MLLFLICSTNRKPIIHLFLGYQQIHRRQKFPLFYAKDCQKSECVDKDPSSPPADTTAAATTTPAATAPTRPTSLPYHPPSLPTSLIYKIFLLSVFPLPPLPTATTAHRHHHCHCHRCCHCHHCCFLCRGHRRFQLIVNCYCLCPPHLCCLHCLCRHHCRPHPCFRC